MARKPKKKNNKVYISIIELLCIIIILFVLIVLSLRIISNISTKVLNSTFNREQNVITATEKYLSSNPTEQLKIIGQRKVITLKELKKTGYLNDFVKDNKNNSCMSNSYVEIYKDKINHIEYIPYIYCDEFDETKDTEVKPTVNLYFLDTSKEDNIYNISNATAYIELTGGNTIQNTALELVNYRIQILIKNNNELKEVYKTEKKDIKEIKPVFIRESLLKDSTNPKVEDLIVKVKAENIAGKIIDKEFSLKQS